MTYLQIEIVEKDNMILEIFHRVGHSYYVFMFVALPFGIALGFVFPTNQSLVSYIESKTNKIYTPLYQACTSAGSLSGALVAAYVIKNDISQFF